MIVHVPIPPDNAAGSAPLWFPFLEKISKRSRIPVEQLTEEILTGLVQVHIAWEPDAKQARGLAGTRIMSAGTEKIFEFVWCAGEGASDWFHLIADIERYAKEHLGCSRFHAIARPGWSRGLKERGYRMTHIVFEKDI